MDRFCAMSNPTQVSVRINPSVPHIFLLSSKAVCAIQRIPQLSSPSIPLLSAIVQLHAARHRNAAQQPHSQQLLNQGLSNYYNKDYEGAIKAFNSLLLQYPENFDGWYNLGVVWQQAGHILKAMECYQAALLYNPSDTRSRLNLATLYHMRSDIHMAIEHYRNILDIVSKSPTDIDYISKVKSNLGAAYIQIDHITNACRELRSLLSLLLSNIEMNCLNNPSLLTAPPELVQICHAMQYSFDSTSNMLLNAERSVAGLSHRERTVNYLLWRTLLGASTIDIQRETGHDWEKILLKYDLPAGLLSSHVALGQGPLLPFDTLVEDISLPHRYLVARAKSNAIETSLPRNMRPQTQIMPRLSSENRRSLRIGFISYDINDHPTSHLVEGIFSIASAMKNQNNSGAVPSSSATVELIVFSYGRDDGSIYRRNLQKMADKFVDLVLMGDLDAVDAIRREDIDIMLDMQLHTLGHRLEITAAQPSPTQINYLVYPGTSGASFIQYLVADAIVVPPEHAPLYSESMILMPPPYQISFFDRYNQVASNGAQSLPARPLPSVKLKEGRLMVLSNFNKIDKMDFNSLAVWSQILSRHRCAEFWFLNPAKGEEDSDANELTQKNIRLEMAARGIPHSKIKFVDRVSKEEHILRHLNVDLFLDTMIYGAHSTATDALAGGLPVLTVNGDSFPSRVGASLLSSFRRWPSGGGDDQDIAEIVDPYPLLEKMLVTFSRKSFEDEAIRLLRSPHCIDRLRELLNQARSLSPSSDDVSHEQVGLFNTRGLVRDFVHAMEATGEINFLLDNSAFYLRKPAKKGRLSSGRPHIIVGRT